MNIDDIYKEINAEASKVKIGEEDVPGPAQDDIYKAVYEDLPAIGSNSIAGNFTFKIRDIIRYHSDEKFVDIAYLKILGREADPAGKFANLTLLVQGRTTRYDILRTLLNSDEYRISGRRVRIRGIHTYKRINKLKKAIKKIPGIRWLSLYLYNLIHLNRLIRKSKLQLLELSKGNFDLQTQLAAVLSNFCKFHKQQEIAIEKTYAQIEDIKAKQQNVEDQQVRQIELILKSLADLKAKLASPLSNRVIVPQEQRGEISNSAKPPIENDSQDTYYEIDYFDFENHFRGSRDHVKKVREVYLPYFKDRKHVVDLGCGRGEFTELLKDNNIGVTGVDMYQPYVEYMKLKQLPVVCADAIQYLREVGEVDGIFVGQVVEHLKTEQIIELIRTAYEKLTAGNYLVMETPNPQTLAVFTHAFYIDPSHNHPVHPLTLKYLTEKEGFKAEILYTESSRMPEHIPAIRPDDPEFSSFNEAMRRLSDEMYGSQDYAVIAKKQ